LAWQARRLLRGGDGVGDGGDDDEADAAPLVAARWAATRELTVI